MNLVSIFAECAGHPDIPSVPAIAALACACLAPLAIIILPVPGSALTCIAWCACAMMPQDTARPPFACMFGVCLAVAVLEYRADPAGYGAAVVVGVIAALAQGRNGSSPESVLSSMPVMIPVFLCVALCGRVIWHQRCDAAMREQLRRRQEHVETARRLHDSIATELSDALMAFDLARRNTDGSLVADDAALGLEHLRTANTEVRSLIDSLERVETATANPPSNGGSSDLLEDMRTLVREQSAALTAFGFDGEILLPERLESSDTDPETSRMLLGLLGECCANIRRHADADYGYVLSVESTDGMFTVRMRDIAHSDSGGGHAPEDTGGGPPMERSTAASHTGLRRYREELEAVDGTLSTTSEGRSWSLEATIPHHPSRASPLRA